MLYQQGTQKIEIVVRKEGGSAMAGTTEKDVENNSAQSGNEESNNSSFNKAVFGTNSPRKIRRVLITNATHLVAVTNQVARLGVNYFLTGLGFRNGDAAYQDTVQRGLEVAQDGAAIASSMVMGAVYGAWGGPIGAVMGSFLNTASTTASIMTKYKYRGRDYDIKMFKENNEIQYNRARAGINLTNGRLR